MTQNNSSLVNLLKSQIRQTRDISNEIVNALYNIQETENTDLSNIIEHIKNADFNLKQALQNIGQYETNAIHRVQLLFEQKYNNNNPLSHNPSLFQKVWNHLTKNK
ncbi:MAG: hypothetical protein AAF349_07530 [Cyanobacteria bacterium P01_A01_bin.68]